MTVTGTLTVRFVKPVPIDRPLVARSWVEEIDGKKRHLAGELVLASSDAKLAVATGIFIARDKTAHFDDFADWLAEQSE